MPTMSAVLLAALLSPAPAMANTPAHGAHELAPADRSAMQRALDRQLNRYIIYPMMSTTDMTGAVTVELAVNAEGRIEVISASSTNEALKDYVLGRLAMIHIGANPGGTSHQAHIRFVFRPGA